MFSVVDALTLLAGKKQYAGERLSLREFAGKQPKPELTQILMFILASSFSLWYHFRWFHESRRLYVSFCKYTTTEFLAG
ncbi:MAG: hypothetical protein ACYTGS_02800, partial [Planctomycetota bacterium]